MTAPIRRSPEEPPEPPETPTPAAARHRQRGGWVGAHADPDWRPPVAGTLRLGAAAAVGPWGYQRPNVAHDSRPLRAQFARTYPDRAFPVRLESSEAHQLSCACADYRRQMRDPDAA